MSCHGSDGTGRAGGAFPNLSLQTPQYLYNALHAFASGQRQSGIMWTIAADPSDDEMRAVAAQLGGGTPIRSHENTVDGQPADAHERGLDIVTAGVGKDPGAVDITPAAVTPPGVARCSSCHLPGVYLGQIIPKLEGQYAPYLRSQMRAFRAGGRGNTSTYNPMVKDGHNLSDSDIEALATFYA